LEAYVSRLRQLFNGHGPSLARRGAGYSLELGGSLLDVRRFTELLDDVSHAIGAGDEARVSKLAAEALALWRGPALADIALASAGRAEAERLEELRLRTLEQRVEAELALGRHEELVGELQALVGQNPYRERFVGQLMLALYRSGRAAGALQVYEKTRGALDEDLGLQPSAELQQLSGQIVRQEPQLRRPRAAVRRVAEGPVPVQRARRLSGLAAMGVATVAAMAFTTAGSTAVETRAAPTSDRLAIILPGSREDETVGKPARALGIGLRSAERIYDLTTASLFLGDDDAAAENVAQQVDAGGFGLAVVLGGGAGAKTFAQVVPKMPETRFVFFDTSLRDLSLENAANAAAVRFAEEDSTYLAGYLSGLATPIDDSRDQVDTVSVVAGVPGADTKRLVAAFTRGLRNALRGARVYVDYSGELVDPTRCERLANRRIDMGADVVFAAAGRCGLGALAVARTRGVWGIGADDDGVNSASHILGVTYKEWERAGLDAVQGLLDGTLPMGKDLVLGLEDDYAVGVQMSYVVPDHIQSLVVYRCSEIRTARALDADH
ncbi:MAG: BMP family ABC transporter substrate-binding protein, partial [Actinobacteria bacterium]|nr:BMP family ABC transporter substrate-binding protein [Actinomycetota bacterium]